MTQASVCLKCARKIEMGTMEELLKYKLIILSFWAVLLLISEIMRPHAIRPAGRGAIWPRYGRNIGLMGITMILSPTLIATITIAAVEWGPNWRSASRFFENIPVGWALLIDFLILDFFIYWWHRFNHIIPFLWRFHEVHHLDAFLDVTSATRFHFGEVILSAVMRGGVILLLDIPLLSIVVFETIVLFSSLFQHSNIRISDSVSRYLSYVIVTPNWHWMHHHAKREDTDSNYGNSLTIWDRLFGSKNLNSRQIDMKIGVERRPERSFFGLILRPLDKP